MEKKKLLFVYNARSGKGNIKSKLAEIVDIMTKAGYDVLIHPTQEPEDAKNLTKDLEEDFDLVVCSGGDGTLDEVVTGMMQREKKVPIGYIPAGSTNDFGSSLKIPKDMVKAAHIAVEGKRFPCDIGYFNGDSFVYVAAFGAFTEVSYGTSQSMKNILGHGAYLLEATTKALHELPAYHIRVEYEDTVIEDDFIFGMITNSVSIGGFKNIAGKNVLLDDGLFEVTLIKEPKNPLELNEILACLTNLIDDSDLIYTFKTDRLKLYPLADIAWTLDGEFGGEHMETEIRCEHKALDIMVKN